MKFNKQEYAKNILELCENFYNDSNLPKIDLIEPILKVTVYHNFYTAWITQKLFTNRI